MFVGIGVHQANPSVVKSLKLFLCFTFTFVVSLVHYFYPILVKSILTRTVDGVFFPRFLDYIILRSHLNRDMLVNQTKTLTMNFFCSWLS